MLSNLNQEIDSIAKPTPAGDAGLLHPLPSDDAPRDDYAPFEPQPVNAEITPSPQAVEQATTQSAHGLVRAAGGKLSREDEAKLALEHTTVSRPVAWTLSVLFLLTIVSVPFLQHVVEIGANLAARQAEAAGGEPPQGRILPQSYDVFAFLPTLQQMRATRNPHDAWKLLPSAQSLHDYETSLEDASVAGQWFLPRAQFTLTNYLGVGNEQAYVGHNGWLMYRPDVEYLTNRGFLDPVRQQARKRSGGEDSAAVQPDPIKAIVRFKEQLAARGIDLIVMPIPVKPMLEADKLSARYKRSQGLLQNPSYGQFLRAMAQEKVRVFDVSQPLLQAQQKSGQAQYLQTDTHWTPAAMDIAARELAGFIQGHITLPAHKPLHYTRQAQSVSNEGDIATMLKLPTQQALFPPQTVQIQPVSTRHPQAWQPAKDADILLLGDSFSNIYSQEGLGWGKAAGLAAQLSFHLQRPVDAIAINAGGAYASRQQLCNELARGHDRLAHKRVVVWEFSMRDLMSGDWKLLNLPGGGSISHFDVPRANPAHLRLAGVSNQFRRALDDQAARVERSHSQVLHGTEGWLYYLDDIYYVTTGGFLHGADSAQIRAIVDFRNQLARRGIQLLVMPMPVKPTIYPEHLGIPLDNKSGITYVPQNPSFAPFRKTLENQGIGFFDPTITLLEAKQSVPAPLFMPTDSHWSPDAAEAVAARLTDIIKAGIPLPDRAPINYTRRAASVRNITDTSMMLKPVGGKHPYVRQTLMVQRVFTPDGKVWTPSRSADILILGDSFTNIYSKGGYWGKGAGMAEQLSYRLQRPIDVIAIDGGGVSKTRQELLRRMLHGEDHLVGKKLVIYEFASRYLMGSKQWKVIKFPASKPVTQPAAPTAPQMAPTPRPTPPAQNLVVRGKIKVLTKMPQPGTVPYGDMIMTVRLSNVQAQKGHLPSKDIVVYVWGMRNQVLTKAAGWQVGQYVTVRLTPWQTVDNRYGSYNRAELEGAELEDDEAMVLDNYWGEEVK